MAKAKKLPSGQWRTLVYSHTDSNGKRKYASFTAATRKESEYLAAEFALNKKETIVGNITVFEAVDKYLLSKEHILSPSTILGYQTCKRYMETIYEVRLFQLSKESVQVWVNSISKDHSPKTVKNAFGLLSAVLKYNEIYLSGVQLPQKIKPTYYVPSDSEIMSLIVYINGYDAELLKAVYLAAFGTLRRSEICGLCAEDIIDNVAHVRRAVVMDQNRQWVTKTTKTVSSDRYVELPDFVIESFPKEGPIVNLHPNNITDRFHNAIESVGIKKFRFHDLRHYSASIMHALSIPDQYVMQRGGWASDSVLKQVYRGTINDYSRHYTDKVNKHFSDMQHKMQHDNKKPL